MSSKKSFARRGQVMLLYALLVPVFFVCAGIGIDMGWYYLNVSRLQNAADAAAVAGAHELIDKNPDSSFTDYKKVRLVDKFYADNETNNNIDTEDGDKVAADYALKNLSSDAEASPVTSGDKVTAYTLTSSWGIGGSSKITLTPSLYKIGEKFYYVIHLSEKIQHLFMPGWFAPMDAPVVAIATLSKSGDDNDDSTKDDDDDDDEKPLTPEEKEKKEVTVPEEVEEKIETAKNANSIVGNWEVQNFYRQSIEKIDYYANLSSTGEHLYVGAWNMFQDEKVHYKNGDLFRTETINILDDVVLKNPDAKGSAKYADSNVSFGAKGSSVRKTKASSNGITENQKYYASNRYNTPGNPYAWQDLESLDVDFQPEVGFKEPNPYLSKDWDLELGYYNWSNQWVDGSGRTNTGVGKLGNYGWSDHLRIHSTINFDDPYYARDKSSRDSRNCPTFYGRELKANLCCDTPTAPTPTQS